MTMFSNVVKSFTGHDSRYVLLQLNQLSKARIRIPVALASDLEYVAMYIE